MIFAQMLEIVALIDLVSVLCARKFSFDFQADLPAAERPQHCDLVFNWFNWFNFFFFTMNIQVESFGENLQLPSTEWPFVNWPTYR